MANSVSFFANLKEFGVTAAIRTGGGAERGGGGGGGGKGRGRVGRQVGLRCFGGNFGGVWKSFGKVLRTFLYTKTPDQPPLRPLCYSCAAFGLSCFSYLIYVFSDGGNQE